MSKTYLVETITLIKKTYAITAKEAEHASDTVVCNEAEPFIEERIDECITGVREISMPQLEQMQAQCGAPQGSWVVDYDTCKTNFTPSYN